MPDLSPGTELGGCRVEQIIGRGGMGVVYRATQLGLERPVALKLIAAQRASDPAFRWRFQREARLTAAIDHPNVIPIYAAGEQDGDLYLVMRYVAGTDLEGLLRREGRLAPERAVALIAQVAGALDAAHAAGLIHRDVKPANVLIAGEHVYLSDFGITHREAAETRLTESGEWVGSVDYVAPEQARGERVDARSDIYSLGCVLYAALTGRPPFRRAGFAATLLAHLSDQPPRPSQTPGVPEAFDAIVARALSKDPAARFASAGELAAAALAAVGQAPARAERSARRAGPEPETESQKTTATTLLGGSTAIATVPAEPVVLPVSDGAPPPDPAPMRVHRGSRRAVLAGLAAAVVVVVLAVLGAVLASRGEREPRGPLRVGEVEGAARSFARAYAREDADALRRMLAPDVTRVSTDAVQRGRSAVLDEYRRQFAAGEIEDYRLSDLDATGGRVGRASGGYTVVRRGRPPITGRLVLGVVRDHGHAAITLIAAEPRG